MATRDTVLAKILIDDQTKLGFNSYARNVERAKKTSEAFRKNAIDKVALGLETQVQVLKKSAKELDLLTAANHGASQAQLDHISTLHQAIDAHKRDAAAQEEASRQTKLKADQDMRAEEIAARAVQQLNFEGEAADKTADEIQILRLRMQGLNDEQIESVKAAQAATAGMRGVDAAAGKASKGGLRIMRGGFGQLGHQIQDISVQLQMGQNALLVFGQQGSQIASLFGQNGALIGAFLAVGAAIGTALAPKLFSSKSAMDELKKAAEETAKILEVDFLSSTSKVTEEFAKLSKQSKELADNRLRIALVNAVEAADLAMKEFNSTASVFFKGFDPQAPEMQLERLANKFDISTGEAEKLRGMFLKLGLGGEKAASALSSYVNELAASKDPTDKKSAALIKLDGALLENIHAVKKSVTTQKLLQDTLNGTSEAYKDSTKAAEDKKKAIEDTDKAFKDAMEGYKQELIALEKGETALIAYNLRQQGVNEWRVQGILREREKVKALEESNRVTEEAAAKEEALASSKKSFVEGVVAQADALGKSNIELLQANALTDQLSSTQKEAFDAAIQRLKDFKVEQDKQAAVDQSASALQPILESLMTEEQLIEESYLRRNRIIADAYANGIIPNIAEYNKIMVEMEKKKQEDLDALNDDEILRGSELTGSMLGELGKQFSGVQAVNKKMFAAQKAFRIANAIQTTFTAANNALALPYPPPLPQIFAATAVAAGLANVAQIRATSFDGGGFTGGGSRSGGMDGKGGFPAILHPNETVIDHTKGQGGGVTIVNNIDASGADANVDMKIRAAMQQTSQQTVASIQDLMRRRRFI